jgi:hypothetical protein
MKRTGVVIFHAPAGDSAVERSVASARQAAATDLIQSIRSLVPVVVVVGTAESLDAFRSPHIHRVPTEQDGDFHFGESLQRVIRQFDLESVIYFGSGSGALLSQEQLEDIIRFAQRSEEAALFNNFYSCDFAVFTRTSRLLELPLPASDNGIGFLLADNGVRCYSLPRSLASQFDLDTPIDLLLLERTKRGGPRLREFLGRQSWEHPTLDGVCRSLCERTALVYLIGRVSPVTWQMFERQVACRTAGIIEGRGMKAYSDRHSPMIASIFRQRGFKELFTTLENSADAAIIDSRPLLVDGELPPPRDRFSSDAFRASEIENPRWAEFTKQASQCSVPILLGGHSLVSGGLYLLSEICWKGRDLPRRLHPDPYEGDGNQHDRVPGQALA